MSTKDDAVFDAFDKARLNLRNAVVTMLVLTGLFFAAVENTTDKLKEYVNAIVTIDSKPEILKEYRDWVKKLISSYSREEYKIIFSKIEDSTKFILVDTPTSGKTNLPVTIARKEISTVEGLKYSTVPVLPREINYWLNELPFRLKQDAEVSLFEVDSLATALESGTFNCDSKKRFWTFCDEKESMDPSNYPAGAQYFHLDTTQGSCIKSKKFSTGSIPVACKAFRVPDSSISVFLAKRNIKIPQEILSPPSYKQISGFLGEVKTIDELQKKIHDQKIAEQKLQFSSVNFSSSYIVPGSMLIVSLLFLQMLSNLTFCKNNLSEENHYFSFSITHENLNIMVVSWIVLVTLIIFYIISGFVYIDKSTSQVVVFFIAFSMLCISIIMSAKLSILIRCKVSKFINT